MRLNIDKLWIGIVLGTVVPVITFFIIYLFAIPSQSNVPFTEVMATKGFFTQLISMAVLPNVGVFFIFIWTNKLMAAKGVLASTIILAVFVFAFKIFG